MASNPKDFQARVREEVFIGASRVIIGVTAQVFEAAKKQGFWNDNDFYDLISNTMKDTVVSFLSDEDVIALRSGIISVDKDAEKKDTERINGLLSPEDPASTEFFKNAHDLPEAVKAYWKYIISGPIEHLDVAMSIYKQAVEKVSVGSLTEEQKRKLAEVDSGTFEFPENVKTKEAVVYSKELQETDYYKELEIDIDLKK